MCLCVVPACWDWLYLSVLFILLFGWNSSVSKPCVCLCVVPVCCACVVIVLVCQDQLGLALNTFRYLAFSWNSSVSKPHVCLCVVPTCRVRTGFEHLSVFSV